MWQVISRDLRSLLTVARCTLCKATLRDEDSEPALCLKCSQSLPVDTTPLRGCSPIPWMAAGLYEGRLRYLILAMRQSPDRVLLNALSRTLRDELPRNAVLVPVPSWERGSRANALPAQFMQALCRDSCTELLRRRPGVGQHHLSQRQRWRNVNGAFAVDRTATVRCVTGQTEGCGSWMTCSPQEPPSRPWPRHSETRESPLAEASALDGPHPRLVTTQTGKPDRSVIYNHAVTSVTGRAVSYTHLTLPTICSV